ncbi:MAG: aldehyde dehydrogenase family protein [Mycobacteriales bacterium]
MTSAQTIRSVSPQSPSDVVTEVAKVSADAAAEATAAARGAQRIWWAAGAAGRSQALAAAAERLAGRAGEAAGLVVREVGKPAGEAAGEVARAVAILRYYAQACFAATGQVYPPSMPGLLYTERRPHGVAGLVTPWNFPMAIPLWKAAPALAAGNAVLLKPSSEAVGCAELLGEVFADLVPPGLFQVVPGGAETGMAVVHNADVVSFTGSDAVGHHIAVEATKRGVPVQAEMGGQNAAIVLPDADPAATAAMIAGAAMGYAGQKCTATRRVIVVGDRPEMTEALVEAVRALEPGDPAADGVAVGPVITATARDEVVAAAREAAGASGQVLTGGDAVDGDGWFVRPAVVSGVPADHRLALEETFGPLVLVLSAPTEADAVELANAVPYGLVTSIHGRDASALLAAASGVDTGMVKINAPTTGVDFYAPFGGEKDSSVGPREQGMAALDFYASTRTITFGG